MPFEEFKKVAIIAREYSSAIYWEDANGKHGKRISDLKWLTDEQALQYVYDKYIANREKPIEHATRGVYYQPTLTTPDSSVMDFIREKCECEAITGY